MTTKLISKCCKADALEDVKTNPKDHHDLIDIYICEKCNQECEVEEVCDICDGTGRVSVSEQVYAGEPHMADIGEGPCECSINDHDDDHHDEDN